MAESTPKTPVASPPQGGAPSSWGGPAPTVGARLLVADDNKVNRLLLSRSLELQGHRVACAENGRVALEMLRRESFDLLLLDMEMPEMTGFEVLEQLVADLRLRDLPNVFMTPHMGTATVETRAAMGHRALDNVRQFLAGDAPADAL